MSHSMRRGWLTTLAVQCLACVGSVSALHVHQPEVASLRDLAAPHLQDSDGGLPSAPQGRERLAKVSNASVSGKVAQSPIDNVSDHWKIKTLANRANEPRIALFVTTAGSDQHVSFMKCYPKFVGERLRKADVIMHVGQGRVNSFNYKEAVRSWTDGQKTVHFYPNEGYQRGAMKALHDGFSNGWFEGYDWVIRINPDVVIYDESRIFSYMDMPDISGIFVACCRHPGKKRNETYFDSRDCRMSTDFFAVRPGALPRDAWADYKKFQTAEDQATQVFEPIVRNNTFAMNARPSVVYCRSHGGGIWHSTDDCPKVLHERPWINNREGDGHWRIIGRKDY